MDTTHDAEIEYYSYRPTPPPDIGDVVTAINGVADVLRELSGALHDIYLVLDRIEHKINLQR